MNTSKKLTVDDIKRIRRLYHGTMTQPKLAKMFKVSVNRIGRIVRGETFKGI